MSVETLHDFSLKDVEVIAKTFGFKTEANSGNRPRPDVVLRYGEYIAVYVESEIGRDTDGSGRYFGKFIKRLQSRIEGDHKSSELFS